MEKVLKIEPAWLMERVCMVGIKQAFISRCLQSQIRLYFVNRVSFSASLLSGSLLVFEHAFPGGD